MGMPNGHINNFRLKWAWPSVTFNSRERDQKTSALRLFKRDISLANAVFVAYTGPHKCRPDYIKGRVKVNGRNI